MIRPIILFFSFFSANLLACSCATPSEEESFNKASSVFLAKVTDTTLYEDTELGEAVYGYFDVLEVFKGNDIKTRVLKTSSSSMCQASIVAGGVYLVYSNGSEYEWLNVCTNSRIVGSKEDETTINKYRAKK